MGGGTHASPLPGSPRCPLTTLGAQALLARPAALLPLGGHAQLPRHLVLHPGEAQQEPLLVDGFLQGFDGRLELLLHLLPQAVQVAAGWVRGGERGTAAIRGKPIRIPYPTPAGHRGPFGLSFLPPNTRAVPTCGLLRLDLGLELQRDARHLLAGGVARPPALPFLGRVALEVDEGNLAVGAGCRTACMRGGQVRALSVPGGTRRSPPSDPPSPCAPAFPASSCLPLARGCRWHLASLILKEAFCLIGATTASKRKGGC